MGRRPTDDRHEGSPLLALARYLSDEIPPMLVAEDAALWLEAPQAVVRTVRAWIASQYAGSGSQPMSDYVFHSIKKLHLLAELELLPSSELAELLRAVMPVLIEDCPAAERGVLLRSLEAIGREDAALSSPVEYLHRPGRPAGGPPPEAGPSAPPAAGAGGGGAAGPPAGAAPPAAQTAPVPPAAADGIARGLAQLNVLLDRFEHLAGTAPAAGGAAEGGPAESPQAAADLRRPVLLADIVRRIAHGAPSSNHLMQQLELLGGLGLSQPGGSLIRELGLGLPDWAAPTPPTGSAPVQAAPLQAIRQVVTLSRGEDQGLGRFSELVAVAVEEFNGGHLGRAATLLELAQRMVAEGDVDASVVRAVVGQGFAALDSERLRSDAEHDRNHPMLRSIVSFFPQLSAQELLLELEVESKRERRRFLIEVLRIHGAEARRLALKALRDSVSGERPLSWYVERNMIHLLRRVPRPEDDPLDREVEVLVRSSDLGGPLPLVREAVAGLGTLSHPVVDKALMARVAELEEALLGKRELPHDADDLRGLLDRLIAILAARPSSEARRVVVEHGLRRKGALGDAAGRMAGLGKFSLADQPTVVMRLIEALQAELPTRVFGVTVATARRAELVERLLDAVAGTDLPQVREALTGVVQEFAGQRFAEHAREVLGRLGTEVAQQPSEDEIAGSGASLTGDLEVFGLPNLLQNLADNRLTGVLEIEGGDGRPLALIRFASGAIAAASTSRLQGETAVFELVEHPRGGRFAFTRRQLAESEVSGAPMAVTPLLLEGMRRFDELARAAAVVPDGMRFEAVVAAPPPAADEQDAEVIAAVWRDAADGVAAAECGASLRMDAYRSRRLLADWLEAGALKPVRADRDRG